MRLSRISALGVALDDAGQYAAARHGTDPADMEYLLHQRPAQLLLLLLRLEHSFQGRLQIVGHLVDDVVAADLHAELFGQPRAPSSGTTEKPMMMASEAWAR